MTNKKTDPSNKDFDDYLNDIKTLLGVPDDELEDEDGITISTTEELAAKYEKGMKSIYGDDVILKPDDNEFPFYGKKSDKMPIKFKQKPFLIRLLDRLRKLKLVFFNRKTVTTNYTVVDSDNRVLIDATAGNVTITLPAINKGNKVIKVKQLF